MTMAKCLCFVGAKVCSRDFFCKLLRDWRCISNMSQESHTLTAEVSAGLWDERFVASRCVPYIHDRQPCAELATAGVSNSPPICYLFFLVVFEAAGVIA